MFAVRASPDGALTMSADSLCGSIKESVSSGPLLVSPGTRLSFLLAVTEDGFFQAYLNGRILSEIPSYTKIDSSSVEKSIHTSLAAGKRQRLDRRRSLKREHNIDWEGFIAESRLVLRYELLQLQDMLKLLDQGRSHNISGISNIIRKLLSSRPGNRVLLNHSAATDVEVLVSTQLPTVMSITPSEQYCVTLGAADHQDFPYITNIEGWLGLSCGFDKDGPKTNEDFLCGIGDKIGAHRDWSKGLSVELLEGTLVSNMPSIEPLLDRISRPLLSICIESFYKGEDWTLQE